MLELELFAILVLIVFIAIPFIEFMRRRKIQKEFDEFLCHKSKR